MPEKYIYAQGVIFMDYAGENIEIGALQDSSFEDSETTDQLFGAASIHPLDEQTKSKVTTLRAAWADFNLKVFQKLTGGQLSYDAGTDATTLTVSKASLPTTFSILLKTPSDGSDAQMKLFRVRPSNFSIPWGMREYSKPNAQFTVLVDPNTDKVWEFVLPGDQT